MKTIWLVTHAETLLRHPGSCGPLIPDPEMGYDGIAEIAKLKAVLNENLGGVEPAEVHCGTGRRQWQVACALGYNRTEMVLFSSLWGEAATIVQKSDGKKLVLLGHGLLLPWDQYLTTHHVGGKVIRAVIADLPHNSVICSGRPPLLRLGMKPEECHNGALYSLTPDDTGEIKIELVKAGKIITK